ncbi:hypothetical protein ACJX0J_034736, partial [Zea mays]
KKEEDNMNKKKREYRKGAHEILGPNKKNQKHWENPKKKKGVAPLMRHMISQYKFQFQYYSRAHHTQAFCTIWGFTCRLLGGFGISLAGLKYLKGWDWNLKGVKKRRDQIAYELRKLEEIEESDLLNSNQIDYSIPAEFYQICWDI